MIGTRRVDCLWLVVFAAAADRSGIDPQAGLQGSTRAVCSVDCANCRALRGAWPVFLSYSVLLVPLSPAFRQTGVILQKLAR